MLWTHVRGVHPQTGQDLDEYDCALKWMPLLMIENAKEARHTKAAIESFRNVTAQSLRAIPIVAIPMMEKQ